jgi:hypothetical protein
MEFCFYQFLFMLLAMPLQVVLLLLHLPVQKGHQFFYGFDIH